MRVKKNVVSLWKNETLWVFPKTDRSRDDRGKNWPWSYRAAIPAVIKFYEASCAMKAKKSTKKSASGSEFVFSLWKLLVSFPVVKVAALPRKTILDTRFCWKPTI